MTDDVTLYVFKFFFPFNGYIQTSGFMISGWQVAKANITLMDTGEGSMINRRRPAAKMQNIIIYIYYI